MPIHPTKFCNVMMWEAVIINWKNIYIKSCTNNSKFLHLIRSILDKTGYTDLLNYKSMNSYASFNKWRSTCWGLSRYWSLQMLRLVLTSWWRWRPVIIVTSPSSSSLRNFFVFCFYKLSTRSHSLIHNKNKNKSDWKYCYFNLNLRP